MSLKEQKYEKALNAMLAASFEAIYEYVDDAEFICISDRVLKMYMMTLKEWINNEEADLGSFPKQIDKSIIEDYNKKGYENTRFKDLFGNTDYKSIFTKEASDYTQEER